MPPNVVGGWENNISIVPKYRNVLGGLIQIMGSVGKRALCPAPCLQATSPRLEEHPLDPEGEDGVRLEAASPLLRRPLGSPCSTRNSDVLPNPGRGPLRPPRLSTALPRSSTPLLPILRRRRRRRRFWLEPAHAPSRGRRTDRTLCCCAGGGPEAGGERCGWSLGGRYGNQITMSRISFLCPS